MFIVFLSLKELLVATFSETCVHTYRKNVSVDTKRNPKQVKPEELLSL